MHEVHLHCVLPQWAEYGTSTSYAFLFDVLVRSIFDPYPRYLMHTEPYLTHTLMVGNLCR